jgi:hypothetical protein
MDASLSDLNGLQAEPRAQHLERRPQRLDRVDAGPRAQAAHLPASLGRCLPLRFFSVGVVKLVMYRTSGQSTAAVCP